MHRLIIRAFSTIEGVASFMFEIRGDPQYSATAEESSMESIFLIKGQL